MFADDEPLYIYVDISFKKQRFSSTISYNINNIYTVYNKRQSKPNDLYMFTT